MYAVISFQASGHWTWDNLYVHYSASQILTYSITNLEASFEYQVGVLFNPVPNVGHRFGCGVLSYNTLPLR